MLLVSLCLAQTVVAADWRLQDTNGVTHTLAAQKGKWVLINFWAPWCPSCLQELPDLVAVQKRHADLQVIGIAVMYKNRKEVQEIQSRHTLTYPIVLGSEDTAADFGGLHGLPTSFLYAPNGKLVGSHEGALTESELEHALTHPADSLFTH